MFVNDFYWICDFRDKYGATPKDRLSGEEENYQEIVCLLDSKNEPLLEEHVIKVSVCFQVRTTVLQVSNFLATTLQVVK